MRDLYVGRFGARSVTGHPVDQRQLHRESWGGFEAIASTMYVPPRWLGTVRSSTTPSSIGSVAHGCLPLPPSSRHYLERGSSCRSRAWRDCCSAQSVAVVLRPRADARAHHRTGTLNQTPTCRPATPAHHCPGNRVPSPLPDLALALDMHIGAVKLLEKLRAAPGPELRHSL